MKLAMFLTEEERAALNKMRRDIQTLKTRIIYKRRRKQCRGIESSHSSQRQ